MIVSKKSQIQENDNNDLHHDTLNNYVDNDEDNDDENNFISRNSEQAFYSLIEIKFFR